MSSIPFDPGDPFPLVPALSPELYPAAKRHAASVDRWLGLEVERTEAELRDPGDGEERWIGRHASIFLTPYVELRLWLAEAGVRGTERVVDLGAGYGRLGFVLARHFPEAEFLGLELVPERVSAGSGALRRFGAPRARLAEADLSRCAIPPAELYFLYDFGAKPSIARVLGELRGIAKSRELCVVGRGRAVRDLIEREHPWLGSVRAPVHRAHYSIYRSAFET